MKPFVCRDRRTNMPVLVLDFLLSGFGVQAVCVALNGQLYQEHIEHLEVETPREDWPIGYSFWRDDEKVPA